MPAARYWRVLITRVGGAASCSELQMREVSAGSNVATGGTASASSVFGGGLEADKAFDGNTSTLWAASTAEGTWIKYDMGSGVTRDIVEITWRARSDGFVEQNPSDLTVQYSSDDTFWTDAWRVHHTAFTATGETRTFTKPGAFAPTRYWAVRMGYGTGNQAIGGAELEMAETNGGADITGTRTSERALSVFSGTPVANLFDDNNSTIFSSGGSADTPDSMYVAVDFGVVKTIEEFSWTARPSPNEGQSPTRWWVEWSPDNINFLERWSGTSPATWSSGEKRTFQRLAGAVASVTGRLRRVRAVAAASASIPNTASLVGRLNRITTSIVAKKRLPGTVITAQNLVDATRRLTQDTLAPQRFTDAALLNYMNMVLTLLCNYRPDLFSEIKTIGPTAGSPVQTLPTDAVRLVEVFSTGAGTAVTEVNRETLDQMHPQWVSETPGVPVNFMRHPRNPRSYFLYPPPVDGTTLVIEYIRALPTYDILSDIPVSQEMFSVIIAGMVFFAEVADAEPSSFDRAKAALGQFMQDAGMSMTTRVLADMEDAAVQTGR